MFTDIARDLVHAGRRTDAEAYLQKALEAAKRGFGESDPHVASAYQNLAELYRLQKQYHLAGPLYDQALAILGDAYGPRDIRVAFALHNVAGYYFSQRDWDKASQYYEQALAVKVASVGPGHMETANTEFHLAEVRWAQKRYKEAIQLGQKALEGMEQQSASDAACLRRRLRVGEWLMAQGEWATAEPLLRKAVLGSSDAEAMAKVPAAESLARVLKERGKYEEARGVLEDCVERRKVAGGGEHPATAAALRRLAEVYMAESAAAQRQQNRPGEVVERQLRGVECAREAVRIAEGAYATATSASGCGSGQRDEDSTEKGGEGWWEGVLNTALPGRQQKQQLQQLQSVLKKVRPEVAAIELSSCLVTLYEVEQSLQGVGERDGGGDGTHREEEEEDGVLLLTRALKVLTKDWPTSGTVQRHAGALEEMRRKGVCRVVMVMKGRKRGGGEEEEGLAELMATYRCEGVEVAMGGKKKRGFWRKGG